MMFRFSKRSREILATVKPELQEVVRSALAISRVDFAVVSGLRTPEEQEALIKAGRSHLRKSKHLTGDAVDLFPLYDRSTPGDFRAFLEVADAMRQAALDQEITLRWGGAWTETLNEHKSAMSAYRAYLMSVTNRGRKPWIDMYHFELKSNRGRKRKA